MVTSNSMCTLSSACKKSTNTYLFPFASIAHYFIIASSDMVGELVSSLIVNSLCDLQLAHPLAFNMPSLFPLWTYENIILSFHFHVTLPVYSLALVLHLCETGTTTIIAPHWNIFRVSWFLPLYSFMSTLFGHVVSGVSYKLIVSLCVMLNCCLGLLA